MKRMESAYLIIVGLLLFMLKFIIFFKLEQRSLGCNCDLSHNKFVVTENFN